MGKVSCVKCGAEILETTFQDAGGLCMPCKLETRESFEASKKRAQEQSEWERSDPYRLLWLRLVDHVFKTPSGFERLSEFEKMYFAVVVLEGEVYNGGFDQYFFNNSGSYYRYAELGLSEMGAMQSLALLKEAKQILFGNREIPEETQARRRLLHGQSPTKQSSQLDKLDKEFWKDADNLLELSQTFARTHGFVDCGA